MTEDASAGQGAVSTPVHRALRRSAGWFVAALVLAVLSIPAIFDLKGLFIALAVICALLGATVATFTWFDQRTR